MKNTLLLLLVLLLVGCNNKSEINVSSTPEGARIYDTQTKTYLGDTPLKLTYLYNSDPDTPECELLRPITAIWGQNDVIITEKDIVVCQNRNYKIVINQNSYFQRKVHKPIKQDSKLYFNPYFGINLNTSYINIDINKNDTSLKGDATVYLYKIGFIDNINNRLEVNYSSYNFKKNKLNLYTFDTIVTIDKLRKKNIEPYFKFGLGYGSYVYDTETNYSNLVYNYGFGVFGYISKNIELDLLLSTRDSIDYYMIGRKIGYESDSSLDSKMDLNSISMGLNFKF